MGTRTLPASSGAKYLSSTLKYFYLSSFLGYLYFTLYFFQLHYIRKENNVFFTPYISPGTPASDLADSLNTNALFVNYVWVLEYAPGYPSIKIK